MRFRASKKEHALRPYPSGLYRSSFLGGYFVADHFRCNSSIVVTRCCPLCWMFSGCNASIVAIFFDGCLFAFLFLFVCIVVLFGATSWHSFAWVKFVYAPDRSKAVPLLQFFCSWICGFICVVCFCTFLFLISPFGATGGLCFVIVAFPGYLHV